MLNMLKAVHNPESHQFQVRLSHGQDMHTRVRNLLVVMASNCTARTLDVLAQGIDVRRLKMEISQGHNAMVINEAHCYGLAEAKMDEHLVHLLFHDGHVACQSG